MKSYDNRGTLSRSDIKSVYDRFAKVGHAGGKDASSGYGGPAVKALLSMASFSTARNVLDYGCGQCKLAELVLPACPNIQTWRGVDQSDAMIESSRDRLCSKEDESIFKERLKLDLLVNGEPDEVNVEVGTVDRFVSTYCLDLLSEQDIYSVLDLAERCLEPKEGLLLLAGITWGYQDSIKTFLMTMIWEILYIFSRKTVGGCRPQNLTPYLIEKGWEIIQCIRTRPDGYPWMMSEVIAARPPRRL